MDSKEHQDPFDLHSRKKIKIKDFLVFKGLNDDQDNYIIKEFEKTKEQTLEALEYIQKIIKNQPDLKSDRIKDYLKRQRYFIKIFLEEVNKESSE